MISLNLENMQAPPAITALINNEVERFRENKQILKQPCHNQGVERHIKLVTEASTAVAGFEKRDELIFQKIKYGK